MITVQHHTVSADAVRLVLRFAGPLPDDDALSAAGGLVTVDGDDLLVEWTWTRAIAPADPVATCTRHLHDVLIAWAVRWSGVGGVDLTDWDLG